ncbi:MAG: electron transfer flavoprotein-ubiquinone oxidoreductase, partial [Planctomycetes bacterium]|nr:electron transfer flavoprotein-ubiquinone oxidoreductase [Planctomycetota bacterium]
MPGKSMERDTLETEVLIVGAGPASLACAIHLSRLCASAGEKREVLVIEKGVAVGQHILSGAVMDPRGMVELFGPRWREEGCPVEAPVAREAVYYLTARRRIRFPFTPPTLTNHGCFVVTLSHVVRWMKEKAEALGASVLEGFPGSEVLWDSSGRRVEGVRTADRGLDRRGEPRESFTPGTDIRAKVTVLGEGTRGSLTKTVVERLGLGGPNPQVYGTGVKELWELPPGRIAPGEVYHTAGWPLRSDHYGGGWIYGLSGDRASIGFVPALDSGDPRFDPWEAAQRWKTHPWIRSLLEGGKVLKIGAKTVPEGGFWSQPRLYGDGFLIAGDAGSFLNAPRLKGIHTAVKSGMLAAEAVFDALRAGRSDAEALSSYERRYRESWLYRELRAVRNVRQAFQGNFFLGALRAGAMLALGGRIIRDRIPVRADPERMERLAARAARGLGDAAPVQADGKLTFDKLTGVYHAGSIHEEDQPSHLIVSDLEICRTRCREEYGNPCERFCPAHVYEMVDDVAEAENPAAPRPPGAAPPRRLQINHSNCVHCKTCDIMDPYGIFTRTVPGDAGGPR